MFLLLHLVHFVTNILLEYIVLAQKYPKSRINHSKTQTL